MIFNLVLLIFILVLGCNLTIDKSNLNQISNISEGKRTKLFYPPVDFELKDVNYSGNPFDIVVDVTFTHTESGKQINSSAFYDGDWNEIEKVSTKNKWIIRFTGTETGKWIFTTSSDNTTLDNQTGTVYVDKQNNPKVKGGLSTVGSSFAYINYNRQLRHTPYSIFDRSSYNNRSYGSILFWKFNDGQGPTPWGERFLRVGETVNDFTLEHQIDDMILDLKEHGMISNHLAVWWSWTGYSENTARAANPRSSVTYQNPDIETFKILERILERLGEEGYFLHISLWRDLDDPATPHQLEGDFNEGADMRLQRYIAARLGPHLNWTMTYGIDLRENWVQEHEVRKWNQNMKDFMGWKHLLTAREDLWSDFSNSTSNRKWSLENDKLGFFSIGGSPSDLRMDSKSFYEIAEDYIKLSSGLPLSFGERFLLGRWDFWTEENTIKAMWQFSMAGYASSYWGVCWSNGPEYNNKNHLRIHGEFWHRHGLLDAKIDNSIISGGYGLRNENNDYIIYKENTQTIVLDLTKMTSINNAIALNSRGDTYREINIKESLEPGKMNQWTAPITSDWVISIRNSLNN